MSLIWRFVAGQVSAPVGAPGIGLVKRASAICALSIGVACAPSPNPAPRTTPPPTRTVETVDVYHGTTIPDPYRWLEDLESEETRDWVTEQNGALAMHLAGDGRRGRILERMRDMLGRLEKFTRELRPVRVAGREFRTDEHRLCVRSGSDAAWRALVDVRRAPAWHAMKFTAALQAAQGCARPIFVRIEELGGHAGSLGRDGLAERIADAWSFAAPYGAASRANTLTSVGVPLALRSTCGNHLPIEATRPRSLRSN